MTKKRDPYDFNAPQYLDFTQGIPEDTDDSYFELAPEDPPTEAKMDEEPNTTDKPQTAESPQKIQKEEPQTLTENEKPHTEPEPQGPLKDESQIEPEPQNLQKDEPQMETEPQGPQMDSEPQNLQKEQPQMEPEPQDGQIEPQQEQDTPMEVTEATGESAEPPVAAERATPTPATRKTRRRSKSVGVRQSPRLLAISKALRRQAACRSPQSGTLDTSRSSMSKGSGVTRMQPQKKSSRHISGVSGLTDDDKKELSAVANFRQKISDNKRKNTHTSAQPLKPTKPQEFHFATDQRIRGHQETQPAPAPAPRPTRSGPTKPQEFTFATDARLKGKETAKEEVEAPVEFARMLRSSSTSSLNKDSAGTKGPTIPQPFHFSDTRRHQQQQAEVPQKFVSMAELNLKFVLGTPERFRTKRAGSVESHGSDKKPRGVTMPHTPNLATSRRRRSLSVMTQEEREMEELEEARKHVFKAKPVNKKVFATPTTGYRVEKKMPTVPEPFNITDSKRAPSIAESLDIDMDESLVSVCPHGGMSFKGTRSKTKVKPFSFDERDKAKMIQKQQKIQQFLEEEKRLAEFHAQPMPVFEDGVHGVPPKKPPTPTQPKPFALRVDQRGSSKQEKFKEQLEKEAQWEAEKRRFHAQGDEVVHKMPFLPEKSKKPLTEISNFKLKTEVRAGERSEYEIQQKAIEEEMLEAKKREEERRKAEELAEVARLRQEAVHKAQPVPKYKPMVIQSSSQPPTVPESPNFATNARLRSRSRANSTYSVDM